MTESYDFKKELQIIKAQDKYKCYIKTRSNEECFSLTSKLFEIAKVDFPFLDPSDIGVRYIPQGENCLGRCEIDFRKPEGAGIPEDYMNMEQ